VAGILERHVRLVLDTDRKDIVRAMSARDVEQSVALIRSHITQHADRIRDIIHMGIAQIYLSSE